MYLPNSNFTKVISKLQSLEREDEREKKRADEDETVSSLHHISSTLLFQTRVHSHTVIRGNPELYETPCITAVADTTIVRAVFVVDGERVAGRTGIE